MNSYLPSIASVQHGAAYYLSGMLMVFVTLMALLALMTVASVILRKLFPYQPPAPPAAAAPAPVPVRSAPKAGPVDAIEPEVLAAIAAAVATTLDGSHRVVSIRQKTGSWEKAGRQSVLSSHRIR